jgi:hypothetical protein
LVNISEQLPDTMIAVPSMLAVMFSKAAAPERHE